MTTSRIALRFSLLIVAALAPVGAQQYVISTYAGGDPPTPAAALKVSVGNVIDLTVRQEIYTSARSVFKIDSSGILTRVAGTGGGLLGDGGPATSAQLNGPVAVATDSDGNVYIVDEDNWRLRKVGPNGIITTIAGNGPGCSGDGGPATSARLCLLGVAVDPNRNLHIGDGCNNRIARSRPIVRESRG